MEINTITVCGAGTMGMGIAQVAAAAGYRVMVYELNEVILAQAKTQLAYNLQQLKEKGKIGEGQHQSIMENISFTSDLAVCASDLVIEAIVENADIKAQLFRELEQINTAETLICTNTSSLSIARLSGTLQHKERFAGLHFFNPATVMKLVEIVKGPHTSERVLQVLVAVTKRMGKVPVVCKDAPGFIVNRVARPYYIESLRLVEEGMCTIEQADRLLESRGFRLGPFKLMDLIGNDVNYAVSCSVYEQLSQPERLKPSYLQKEKVTAGALGRKSGKGYYDY